jgi:ketosteroid isomerase-like protein
MKVESATPPAERRPQVELVLPWALSAGDLGSASACFARDACLITPDATVIHGRDRIRSILAQLIAQRVEVEVELSHVVNGGAVRLVRERWRIRTGIEAPRFAQTLHPTFVLRRVESEWRVAIAAPWGWAGGPL